MQRAWPGRFAMKIGCTFALKYSKSSDGCCADTAATASTQATNVVRTGLPSLIWNADRRRGLPARLRPVFLQERDDRFVLERLRAVKRRSAVGVGGVDV